MNKRIALFLIIAVLHAVGQACQTKGTRLRVSRSIACRDADPPFLGTIGEFLSEADRAAAEEEPGCAEAVCDEMADEFPDRPDAAAQCRGNVLYAQKRFAEALKFYDRVIEAKPDSGFVLLQRAKIHSHFENHEQAVQDASASLRIYEAKAAEPDAEEIIAEVSGWRGYFYLKKGDYRSSLEDFDRSLRLAPERHLFYYGRAEARRQVGQTDLAEEDLRRADELQRRNGRG